MTTVYNVHNAAAPASSQIPNLEKTPEGLLDARLREVQAALADSTRTVHDLVRRLAPVLPHDFGQRAVSQATPPRDAPPSPLAADLVDLADQCQQLVGMLREICEAVDL